MKELFSKRVAGIVLIASLIFLMFFHLLVALSVLPSDIVWSGTMDEDTVVIYEIVAFIITGVLLCIAIVKAGYINNRILTKIAKVFIWIMVVYFALMIFANLTAKTLTEKVIFIPLSVIMFASSLRLAIRKD